MKSVPVLITHRHYHRLPEQRASFMFIFRLDGKMKKEMSRIRHTNNTLTSGSQKLSHYTYFRRGCVDLPQTLGRSNTQKPSQVCCYTCLPVLKFDWTWQELRLRAVWSTRCIFEVLQESGTVKLICLLDVWWGTVVIFCSGLYII